jgi:hypothetical protein
MPRFRMPKKPFALPEDASASSWRSVYPQAQAEEEGPRRRTRALVPCAAFCQPIKLQLNCRDPLEMNVLLVSHFNQKRFHPRQSLRHRLDDGSDDWEGLLFGTCFWHSRTLDALRTPRLFHSAHTTTVS